MVILSLITRKGRRRFARYRHILTTLVAYGFGEIVYQTGFGKLLRVAGKVFRRRETRRRQYGLEQSPWARIRLAVEQLGPTFIKLGQILSNRPDLIPRPLQEELAKLQRDVPSFPGAEARSVIEEELGRSVNELFSEFDEAPFAAASIAQIHRVLTMEFIEARPISDYFDAAAYPEELRSRLATIGANATLEQIFTHGFFHADPHPGNISVIDEKRLCFLDFGLTGSLIQRDLEVFSDILIGLISHDEQKVAKAVIRLGGSRDYEIARSMERDIAELIDQFQSAQAGDFSLTGVLAELVELLVDKGLKLPSDLYLLVKALITIEGVAIVLAALIVGSSIVVHSGAPPLWHDVPVIGVAGFIAAGVVGLGLLVKAARAGRGS